MRTHDLKTWPDVFASLWDGSKTAEFRLDDRGFEVGDVLRLQEYDPAHGYSGREILTPVTHIARGGRFGIPLGYVMMSLGAKVKVSLPAPGGY